ncbi:hypothetical protein BGW80DRAFT_1447592 [Lactifluus volemus]|nr:hypothetical protein BGW80DRAFT_1447592 [Lactifluus volemus]
MLSRTRGVGAVSLKVAFDAFTLLKVATMPRSSAAVQLPVELLQNIFLLLARLYTSEREDYLSLSSQSRPDWIAVTHVCRYWRSAALGLHQLWSSITPGLPISWAKTMLERSAPLPVHIDVRISSSPGGLQGLHPLAASELLFSASRIRTLRLVGLRVDILHLLNHLRSPSPLESLCFSIYDSGPPVQLPETLFGGKAPNLRCLTFAADTCIRAPLWLFKGITEFTTGADFSILELLDALRAMPLLEVLRVQHCRAVWEEADNPDGLASSSPSPARVTLPHLNLISFRDTTPRRFVLLSLRIDAPSTVRRHLFWRSWAVSSWERWSSLLSTMRTFVPRDSAPRADDGDLRVARVTGGPARGSFATWTRSASARATSTSQDDALFLFQIDWVESPVDPRSESLLEHSSPFFHLASLCETELGTTKVQDLIVVPDVEQLEVTTRGVGMISMTTMHWELIARSLPSVDSLRLHRGTSSLLSRLPAYDLLPRLQKLYVTQCVIKYTGEQQLDGLALWNVKRLALRGTPSPGFATHDIMNVGYELVELVRSRHGLEVILIDCSVDGDALETLRKHAHVDIGDEWVYI